MEKDILSSFENVDTEAITASVQNTINRNNGNNDSNGGKNNSDGTISFNIKPYLICILFLLLAAVMSIVINHKVLEEYSKTLNDSVISKYSVGVTISDVEFIISDSKMSDDEKLMAIQATINDLKEEISETEVVEEIKVAEEN